MKRILLSLLIVLGVGGLAAGATTSFFSDEERSSGNLLQAGAIDLKIDNKSYYNGVYNEGTSWLSKDLEEGNLFFNFRDLKPGDWGEDTISVLVHGNPSWVCADITLTSNDDNEPTEPESLDDQDTGNGLGELAGLLNFIWWADDGDNVLEANETPVRTANLGGSSVGQTTTITLADSLFNMWGGTSPFPGEVTKYIGKAWYFGNLTVQPKPQASYPEGPVGTPANAGILCDGSALNNASQTDSVTADISFRAIQARHNPNFTCQCTELSYANSYQNASQGTRKDGGPIEIPRTNPASVLGPPDGVGSPASGFFSLGFIGGSSTGGTITVSFGTPVLDLPGPDLSFHEITNSRASYPEEKAKVEVSSNNINWYQIGFASSKAADGVTYLDIAPSGLYSIKYVRLTDVTNPAIHSANADGYDIDAINAKHAICIE